MRNKFDKLAHAWRNDCIRRFGEKLELLQTAYDEYIEDGSSKSSDELKKELQKAIDIWNGEIADANGLITYVSDKQQAYFLNRTEAWQESDAGAEYSVWMESIEDIQFDEIDATPEGFDIDDYVFDEVEKLENMPTSVEEAN